MIVRSLAMHQLLHHTRLHRTVLATTGTDTGIRARHAPYPLDHPPTIEFPAVTTVEEGNS